MPEASVKKNAVTRTTNVLIQQTTPVLQASPRRCRRRFSATTLGRVDDAINQVGRLGQVGSAQQARNVGMTRQDLYPCLPATIANVGRFEVVPNCRAEGRVSDQLVVSRKQPAIQLRVPQQDVEADPLMAQGLDRLIAAHHPLELVVSFADVVEQCTTCDSGFEHLKPRG